MEHAQPRPLLARVGSELLVLLQPFHVRAQIGPHAVIEPIARPAAPRGDPLCGKVDEALVFRCHGVHVRARPAKVGNQHQARAAVDGDVDDATGVIGDLPELIQGFRKMSRVKICSSSLIPEG
jgi:hypothetical protein